LEEERFLVLAPTLAQRRTEMLLRRGLPSGATVTDVTGEWATLHLAGPRSRELLARLTTEDLSNDGFPFLTAREIEVAWAPAWAFRVSYTGELGWELTVPTEFVTGLYDRLVEAGRDLDLRHAGAFAFDTARMERGFRSWGHDMGQLDDPFQAGLAFAVRSSADYVGRDALEQLRDRPPKRQLVSVHVPDAVLWHGESLLRDGERVGYLTSASIAPTLGGSAAIAWARGALDGEWTVETRGEQVPARVQLEPFHDPRGERARG
jgi:4-methylaminobutanoate oxidase (formaldehyde-forming)